MKYPITDPSVSNSYLVPDMDYIKLRQDRKITCLYTLLPPKDARPAGEPTRAVKRKRGRPRKAEVLPELTCLENGTAKIVRGEDCIYIDNYGQVTAHSKGGYRLNTYRLLDFLIWQLDGVNRLLDGRGYMTPLCTQLTLPLDFLHPLLRL